MSSERLNLPGGWVANILDSVADPAASTGSSRAARSSSGGAVEASWHPRARSEDEQEVQQHRHDHATEVASGMSPPAAAESYAVTTPDALDRKPDQQQPRRLDGALKAPP
jgi:hypothetical protein